MERYGSADLIRDILERQGLVWLLESLAQDKLTAQKGAGLNKMHDKGKYRNNSQGDYYTKHIITENDADKTYLINCAPNTIDRTFPCENEISCTEIIDIFSMH